MALKQRYTNIYTNKHKYEYKYKHCMLILANARCSICLHGLMCYRTEDIHISIHCSSIISFHQSCRDDNVLPHSFTALDVFID